MSRILLAFLVRDARIQLSYRLEFVLNAFSILSSVATFYFVARLFGAAAAPALAGYGGDYFAFVLIGIAFSTYQGVGLRSLAASIRQEQYLGTLESVLAAPVRLPVFLIASAQWDFLYATLEVALYLGAGVLLFGQRFPGADLPAALLMLSLSLAAFLSIGILSAAFILRFKRGDPIAWLVGAASELLGGVYFPVDILPGWLRRLSALAPMTHSLEGLRRALLQGAGPAGVARPALALAAFTAVALPAGVLLFRRALDAARRDGTLGHY